MNNQPPAPVVIPSAIAPPTTHSDFIKEQLERWVTEADPSLLKELRASLVRSNHSRHDLKELLETLQSPDMFCRPLLSQAINNEFPNLQDIENIIFEREWKNSHLLGLIKNHERTTRQSLLEAALQNFSASEALPSNMEAGTGLYIPNKKGRTQSSVSASQFASLCRRLDLGIRYQQHIHSIIDPPSILGQPRTTTPPQQIFSHHEKNTFEVVLHIAYLQKNITKKHYDDLLSLQRKGQHPGLKCSHLTIDGVVITGVVVIGDPDTEKDQTLYISTDPLQAIRQHRSMRELENQLAQRLKDSKYAAFFNTLLPMIHRGPLLTVRAPYWVSVGEGLPQLVTPEGLIEPVVGALIKGDLFEGIAQQRISQIKGNALALAVSTAEADNLSWQKRRQHYMDIGKSVLFFAASFIPVLGEVLLVVAGAQLIHSVYNGFAAWSRNDSDQALEELLNVVDNVALAVVTAGAIKTARFTTSLIKVKLANGGYRLWNPSLVPYRTLKPFPDGLRANAEGLYEHEQNHYLTLDEHSHMVKFDPQSEQWRMQHPNDPDAHTPLMASNDAGGWRCEHEAPHEWSELKLIRRLGPDAQNITQPMVDPVLRLSGTDRTTLREIHLDSVRPPPALRETIKRFNLKQEIDDFNLERALGSKMTAYSPLIQFYLARSLLQLTKKRALKITLEQNKTSNDESTDIEVPEARLIRGELLNVLEEEMQVSEFVELLTAGSTEPAESIESIEIQSNVQRLAKRLHSDALQQKELLFAWLNDYVESPVTALEADIRNIVPILSRSHLKEMAAVLDDVEKQRFKLEKSLTHQQHWEASQYIKETEARLMMEDAYLNPTYSMASLNIILITLEKLPGWPSSLRIEIRDKTINGETLGIIGPERAAQQYSLIREGDKYSVYDAVSNQFNAPTDLLSAIEQTLSTDAFDITNADTLERVVQRALIKRVNWKTVPIRGVDLQADPTNLTGRPLDPLFAEPRPPREPLLHGDHIYQSQPQPDGSYRYYIVQDGKYFQVKSDKAGWQLIDARSRFRAYKPYIRRNANGNWEIDDNKGALLGGMPDRTFTRRISNESSDDFQSAISSNENAYESADDSSPAIPYTAKELVDMRKVQNYQHSRNYLRHYDRSNNGRYPIRDLRGQPMRIKRIQASSEITASGVRYNKDVVLPYFQWQGYEKVASLYDEKIEVVTFTAEHQLFPEESSLIGQNAVITKRTIKKGEILGIYGGELLPKMMAVIRQDPYLIDIEAHYPPKAGDALQPALISTGVLLSGDNVLSRINTIFEYEAGKPIKQASTGYNTEVANFDVDVIDNNVTNPEQPALKRLQLTTVFATQDISAGTELRWNYGYSEEMIKDLFSEAPLDAQSIAR